MCYCCTNVANQNATLSITDTNLYVPVVTLLTQDNAKLSQQLKSGFNRIINWNEYLSKTELLAQNSNLNHLVKPSFQGINRIFILAYEGDTQRTSSKGYYLPNVELKDYSIMINGENIFDQPIKSNKITYMKILEKFVQVVGMIITTGSLLDYPYFKDN